MDFKISIEIIIPDLIGHIMTTEAREVLHNAFTGSQDYIDDNVVVWDNRQTDPKTGKMSNLFTETGIVLDLGMCRDKNDIHDRMKVAMAELFDLQVPGITTTDTDDDGDSVNDEADADGTNDDDDEGGDESPIPHLLGHYQA